jgi:hypothetical protein
MKRKEDMPKPVPFNPLDKTNLGESVAEALLGTPICLLPPEPFIGAGIYAIYYTGSFEPYKPIALANADGVFSRPIYVGKAVPQGARKGGFGLDANPGTVLHQRLIEHTKSVDQANNLSVKDFHCRYLCVDDIWIPLAESMLIEMFSPLWNKLLDGFGNHPQGSGRPEQRKSLWDTLHPGRPWTNVLKDNSLSADEIVQKVHKHLRDTVTRDA